MIKETFQQSVLCQEFTQEEGRALILVSAESLVEKIAEQSLETWVTDTKRKLAGKHLTLMVYNYNDYFKQVYSF